jgi:transglutaminase-like putative cysteine protease
MLLFTTKQGLLAVVLGLTATAVSAAPAEEVSKERASQMERYNVAYHIQADGSYTEEDHLELKILKPSAIESAKSFAIDYSTSVQKVEIVHAYTQKADGQRIEVPKDNYQIQTNGGKDKNAPVFSDQAEMTIVFPDLAVGDTRVLTYRLVGSKPMFQGQFSTFEGFSRQNYYGDVSIHFDAPITLPVHYEAWQLDPVHEEVVDGRRIDEWHWRNTAPIKPPLSYPVFEFERHPGVVYSTYGSFADIAHAYGINATPKAAVTPRIQKLADQIASDQHEPRAVGQALYNWVARNITYAGNCVGLGAVVPHDLDFVLDNKMGDCKDQATLLQALLAAKGIASTQALINAGSLYRLPRTPDLGMINHVIVYVPAWDMYLDPTSDVVPFGMLPPSDSGKPVFLVDGSHPDAHTPMPPPGQDRQIMHTRMTVNSDGSIKGDMQVDLKGMFAVLMRAQFRDANRERVEQATNAYFKQLGNDGQGSIDYDDAQALSDHYHYAVHFQISQLLSVPGAFSPRPLFTVPASVSSFVSRNASIQVPDEGDTSCRSGYTQEEYRIEFAPSLKVAAVPTDMKLSGADTTYEAHYQQSGNTLIINRSVDDQTPGPLCSPAFMTEYKALMQKALVNVKSQVIYQ